MLRQTFFKLIALIPIAAVGTALAQSNIDNTVPAKRACGENVSWTNRSVVASEG
jgi:hypothetical protein